jgi:N-hydroxyarylamine O-acetyltransferase
MNQSGLKDYLQRIQYSGDRSVSRETLNAITEAHAKNIAFENLDVILGRRIHLSDDAIFQKLVTHGRGGYCFEQNGLLLQVLKHLGFNVTPISGRVRLRFTDRTEIGPRTHVFLRVDEGNESLLTDVGMGSGSLTSALALRVDEEQETPHDVRRLTKVGDLWYHQIRLADTWQDACEFTLEEMPLIDREIANWFTSTHPQSHFRDRLVAALALENGQRLTLQNYEMNVRSRNGEVQKRILQNNDELVEVLVKEFGIRLSPIDREQLKSLNIDSLGQ